MPNLLGRVTLLSLKIAYVLKSFPEPSETFIADEALSVCEQGMEVCLLQVQDGTSTVVHPSAQALLTRAARYRLGEAGRGAMLAALLRLLLLHPLRTLGHLLRAISHRHRWCHLQALPAARWCLAQKVSVLHAHFADVNLMYAAAISAWTGIPYGVTTHRYDIFEDPLDPDCARELLQAAHLLVTISEFNRRHLQQKYGLAPERVHIVHCGIDLSRFQYKARPARGHQLRLLNIGRLAPVKAQDRLLEALSIVRERGLPAVLDLVGAGPLREELQQHAMRLQIDEHVVFHGAQPEATVRDLLERADLFVLSSRSEGLPVVCIEALAVGTPTVATRIFGIPELIEDGESGWLAPPDDPHALADAICTAAATPAPRLEEIRARGRQRVEQAFERQGCTRQLAVLWRDAVQARH